MSKHYWLMKTEPSVFSIDDLQKQQKAWWDSIRNYQARNFMMKDMQVGDEILIYHSSAEPPGVAGLAKVSQLAKPDPVQFDKTSDYFDPKASKEKPIWFCVQIEYVSKLKNFVPIEQLRAEPKLKDLLALKRGQRLSIQPVSEKDFNFIKKLGG